jgi:beta-N-acetylhexosaminidase
MRSPFLIGFSGLDLSDDVAAHLTLINPRGVILFARNYNSPEQLKALTNSLKSLLGNDLIVAVDHEGGRVVRFKHGLPELPAADIWGKEGKPHILYERCREVGAGLREWGITMDLAPVVDMAGPESHPSLSDRCYGRDPELVTAMGIAFIEGMRAAGIQCALKHFPGLGSGREDTHNSSTTIAASAMELERYLAPFRRIIAEVAVDAVLVSHACYPHWDKDCPASCSTAIITELLRKDLGFKGTVITDDFVMKAILNHYDIEEATRKALNAGVDLVTICHEPALQKQAWEGLGLI